MVYKGKSIKILLKWMIYIEVPMVPHFGKSPCVSSGPFHYKHTAEGATGGVAAPETTWSGRGTWQDLDIIYIYMYMYIICMYACMHAMHVM